MPKILATPRAIGAYEPGDEVSDEFAAQYPAMVTDAPATAAKGATDKTKAAEEGEK